MSKEKYIDEMAETICRRELDPNCSTCYFNMDCRDQLVAKKFYNAGYRKQSEVVREIFEEIDKILAYNYLGYARCYQEGVASEIAALKKKYT